MKTIVAGFILSLVFSTTAFSQSDSFIALREKFAYHRDVFTFSTSAFFGTALFRMAGEHEFYDAIKDVKRIGFIIVPKDAFRREHVSIAGFKNVIRQDSFYELAKLREHGDIITFYMKSTGNKNNRYMILVEDSDNVIAIELTGYIDPEFLLNCESHSYEKSEL
jgi:hypothetical protein